MTQLCSICPRGCGVDRAGGQFGFCAVPDAPVVARAAPHFGEEPCISGTRGSGAVFFSGCNLRCVFCQNRTISRGEHGKEITVAQLRDIFLRLRDEGVAIIYVSHRMEEIMRIADRATILRDGQYVLTAPLSELTLDAIISHIVGQEGRNLSMRQEGTAAAGEVSLWYCS